MCFHKGGSFRTLFSRRYANTHDQQSRNSDRECCKCETKNQVLILHRVLQIHIRLEVFSMRQSSSLTSVFQDRNHFHAVR